MAKRKPQKREGRIPQTCGAPPCSNNSLDDTSKDVAGIRRWIESLTLDSFLDAIEFTFYERGDLHKQNRGEQSRRQQKKPSRHEADLFAQMISIPQDKGRESDRKYPSPYMFRWIKDSNGSDVDHVRRFAFAAGHTAKPKSNPRKRGENLNTALPAELLQVLADAGVHRSMSSLLDKYNEPDEEQDDQFPFDESNPFSQQVNSFEGFRLEARQFVTSDGVRLGIGTTIQQIEADENILLSTALIVDAGDICGFRLSPQQGNSLGKEKKNAILRMLDVASRGRFLTRTNEQSEWFDPCMWFSLPMYLASRFESALWKSYRRREDIAETSSRECSAICSINKLGINAKYRVWSHAVYTVVTKELVDTNRKIQHCTGAGDSISSVLNEFPLSHLIQISTSGISNASMPLLEWGTPRAKFKLLVLSNLEESLSVEVKRNLLEMLDEERNASNPDKTKKRTKKKRKKPVLNAVENLASVEEEEVDKEATVEDDEEEDFEVECIIHSHHEADDACGKLGHKVSAEYNENDAKISALVVIDEILDNVFRRVGFEDDATTALQKEEEVPGREPAAVTSQTEEEALCKVSIGDDPEQATTTVASNKASVDAAVSFLNRQDDLRPEAKSPRQSQQLWASRVKHPPKSSKATDIKRSRSKDSFEPSQPICLEHRVSSAKNIKDNSGWESNQSELFPQTSNDENIFDGAPLCLSGALDSWNGVACPQQKGSDILTDLLKPEEQTAEPIFVSSTVASLASSEAEDPGLDIDGVDGFQSTDDSDNAVYFESFRNSEASGDVPDSNNSSTAMQVQSASTTPDSPVGSERSATPPPPPTPPPQLSPILVSLADLTQLRKEAAAVEAIDTLKTKETPPKSPPKLSSERSLPDSSFAMSAPLVRNFSRDDLRSIDERRRPLRRDKDHLHHSTGRPQMEKVNRNVDALLSYRNVGAQSVHRKHSHDDKQVREDVHPVTRKSAAHRVNAWASSDFINPRSSLTSTHSPIINKVLHLDVACARSECAFDGVEDASHCNVIPRDDTMTKDGASTTISSVRSPPVEEQFANVKEERDAYRDLCLTLGAENAKLRNLIASRTCAPLHNPPSFYPEQINPFFFSNPSFEFHFGAGYNPGSFHPVVAKSDAGVPRGEHESYARSEDGTEMYPSVIGMSETQNSMSWQARGDSVHSACRRTSGGGTYAESDTSLEQNIGGPESHIFSAFRHVNRQDPYFGPMPQSRLSRDIHQYMQSLKTQLKRNESRRVWVVEQITKSVNTLWPRAQIKMYGSHMTGLCLPSSDMDFVICLPAVHKNAPARAPGDLEGRNAINETNQKVLSRKLKGESWLDQRSIKVIERTAVPVIKVSTKDSRSRVVQLDLSFDAKEHHGLEALLMIQHILEELPIIRPLVLVLKQFLLDRGLLTAYTGGLSSYCLFLMVARYCQEQSTTWNDSGSLLMGLLDFYGNFFDPRTTGISVGKRQYFSRSQDMQHTQPVSNQFFTGDQCWNMSPQQQYTDLVRRNSFSDKSFGSGGMPAPKPPRFQPLKRQFSLQSPHHAHAPQSQAHVSQELRSYQSGKPYTFDPIWVEDPLNAGNNVGRNAFRIFQVQRAFSDAHRALVAALEWDMNSVHEFGDDGEYPLLKCLLQNEDVFLDNMRD